MEFTDFASRARSSVVFDGRLPERADDSPAYGIERTGQDACRITLAVAGFEADHHDKRTPTS